MNSIEDFPEHIKDAMEKHGAAPAVGILLFGILFLLYAIPVVGEYAKDSSIAALHSAISDDGGGGHGH